MTPGEIAKVRVELNAHYLHHNTIYDLQLSSFISHFVLPCFFSYLNGYSNPKAPFLPLIIFHCIFFCFHLHLYFYLYFYPSPFFYLYPSISIPPSQSIYVNLYFSFYLAACRSNLIMLALPTGT